MEEKVLMSVISAIYCSKLYVRFYPRLTIKDRFYRYGFNVDWMIPSNTWIYDMGMPTSWREAYIAGDTVKAHAPLFCCFFAVIQFLLYYCISSFPSSFVQLIARATC